MNRYETLPPWRRLGRSKARLELGRAEAIAARGIPTPVPLGAGELRRGVLLARCYGLVAWMAEAVDLRRVVDERRDTPAQRRAWTRELGRLVRRMHDAGVDQRDLAPNNFLWRPCGEPRLLAVDFERARLRRRVRRGARHRALAKLERHLSGAPASARLRFLLAYTEGDRVAARALWRQLATACARLARRDLRRAARGSLRGARHCEPLRIEATRRVWTGWGHRDASPERLRAALEGAGTCVRAVPLDDARRARRAWALAAVLHQRGLMPEPLALVRDRADARLLLGAEGIGPLAAAPTREAHAALAVLLDRLFALGRLRPDVALGAFAFAPRERRAVLLDPTVLALGSPAAGGGFARARRQARALLAPPG